MPEAPTSTNDISTTPSSVKTITVVAQVIGTLVTAYGGALSLWANLHQGSLWPGVVLSVAGLLTVLATHFGYVKGQASTQNEIVRALVAAVASPIAVQLIQSLITKGVGSSTPTPSTTAPAVPLPPGVTTASNALTAAGSSPPSLPR